MRVTEVAKLVRQSLKEAFPTVRFSVRSDSAVDVEWTDGPSVDQVKAVVDRFEGRGYDSMTDCTTFSYATLDGVKVCFGCYVMEYRKYSAEFLTRVIARVARKYGAEPVTVEDFISGKAYDVSPFTGYSSGIVNSWQDVINRERHKTSTVVALDSPTARRVERVGRAE